MGHHINRLTTRRDSSHSFDITMTNRWVTIVQIHQSLEALKYLDDGRGSASTGRYTDALGSYQLQTPQIIRFRLPHISDHTTTALVLGDEHCLVKRLAEMKSDERKDVRMLHSCP